jgi:hypothetical protein
MNKCSRCSNPIKNSYKPFCKKCAFVEDKEFSDAHKSLMSKELHLIFPTLKFDEGWIVAVEPIAFWNSQQLEIF